jgi:hypothetical protein
MLGLRSSSSSSLGLELELGLELSPKMLYFITMFCTRENHPLIIFRSLHFAHL